MLIVFRTGAFIQGARKYTLVSTAGTLPDANLLTNFERFGNEKSVVIDAANTSKIITEADLDPSVEPITFCNTGHLVATIWFVLSELAHFEKEKLFPDSMVECINHGRQL